MASRGRFTVPPRAVTLGGMPAPAKKTSSKSESAASSSSRSDRLDARVLETLVGYNARRAWLIVSGFFQQIFDRITIESVREALGQAILRKVREYV